MGERLCSMQWTAKRQVKARSVPPEHYSIQVYSEEAGQSCLEGVIWPGGSWRLKRCHRQEQKRKGVQVERRASVFGVMWYNSGALVSDSQPGQDPSNYWPGKHLLGILMGAAQARLKGQKSGLPVFILRHTPVLHRFPSPDKKTYPCISTSVTI